MDTLFVIIHAMLWSFMEVEMEGKRGWMYDSQTQCSGILAFTRYHLIMNVIAALTVYIIIGGNAKHGKNWKIVYLYNLLLWFVVEDVAWFVINKMVYQTAPWQTTAASIASTILPVVLLYVIRERRIVRHTRFDWILVPINFYIWFKFPWASPFDPNEPFTPRLNYCN
tara:strand:- start:372 stop:875 length:504 start_codon:yes stop_codon:yes gene_type:complete